MIVIINCQKSLPPNISAGQIRGTGTFENLWSGSQQCLADNTIPIGVGMGYYATHIGLSPTKPQAPLKIVEECLIKF